MTTKASTAPTCRKCGSTALTATSSQQFRIVRDEKRLHADVSCDHCGHSWWSTDKRILAASRAADAARKAEHSQP